MACLHRVAMRTLLLSRWSWSVHLVRCRHGGRFHERSGGRPTDSSTWRSMAWCVGMLSGNIATCPNLALQLLIIRSDTGARPVRKETSELQTKSCHLITRILRWFDGFRYLHPSLITNASTGISDYEIEVFNIIHNYYDNGASIKLNFNHVCRHVV